MYFYSIVVPVYNRPEEIDELLESLTHQSYKKFEVIIIEDGSSITCLNQINKYLDTLSIRYIEKENTGQGFSRNEGFKVAKGDYFIVFDSDCIIPQDYLRLVDDHLASEPLDAFGGPDSAHRSFTLVQKAINNAMTSWLTTGGIRGRKHHSGTFHPRSFNMGISRKVFEETGGYKITRMGEDIELSIRTIEMGFKSGLIPQAFVYHKRRTSFIQFFKQLHFFGRARVNIGRFYPGEVRFVHLLPLFFLLAIVELIVSYFVFEPLFYLEVALFAIYGLLIFIEGLISSRNLVVAFLTVIASFIQLSAYGIGFITEYFRKVLKD